VSHWVSSFLASLSIALYEAYLFWDVTGIGSGV